MIDFSMDEMLELARQAELQKRVEADGVRAPEPDVKADVLFDCRCRHCIRERDGAWALAEAFVVCPQCGNKRCPKADDHRFQCSGSNEPGQQAKEEANGQPAGPSS